MAHSSLVPGRSNFVCASMHVQALGILRKKVTVVKSSLQAAEIKNVAV
jgi:hypothetical protein